MRIKKRFFILIAAMIFTLGCGFNSFAAGWVLDSTGWWYDNGDGTWPASCWQWLDGNGDGISECYYFNPNGYCLLDTTTPDGYRVNTDGAWIENGVVQTVSVNGNGVSQESGARSMKITVNGRVLTATLEDNATTRAIMDRLPLTLPMMDLYGREMCYRFDEALPANEARTRSYQVGEIIYWPPGHSFVILYRQNGERFEMQTIGRIDSGVEIFENTGDVTVTFERAE